MDGEKRSGSIAGKSKILQEKSSYDSGMVHHTSDHPSIMAYRRESKTPVYYVPKPDLKHKLSLSKGKGKVVVCYCFRHQL